MYTIEDFKKNYVDVNLINPNVINTLSTLIKELNFKDVLHVKKENFLSDSYKKKGNNDIENWDMIRNFQKTQITKKTGIENDIQKIRKQLNILSEKNFDKINKEVISIIHEIHNNSNEIFDSFSHQIYKLFSSNLLYSGLYSNIYINIIKDFNNFKLIVQNEFSNLDKLFDNIEYCSPDINYDIFCENNKNNEKRRAFCYFLTNLIEYCELDKNILVIKLNILYDILITNLNIENKKNHVDEMSELIYILTSNSIKIIEGENLITLIEKIKMISTLKINDFKSLTNKCLFKNMDLLDEII